MVNTKIKLHFLHGNGFPARSYKQFLDCLSSDFEVGFTEIIGHDPRYPVDDGWTNLVKEVVDQVSNRYLEPVVLVGHSLGGILALLCSIECPQKIAGVVLLDSPIVAGWRSWVLKFAKATKLDMKYSPARFSIKRRSEWDSLDEALAHFSEKTVFKKWSDGVLNDYLSAGLVNDNGKLKLRFESEIETRIYRTLPHDLPRRLPKKMPVPVGFVGGVDSLECRQAGLSMTRRVVGDNFVQIQGGHLVPFEYPTETAQAVSLIIGRLLKNNSTHLI